MKDTIKYLVWIFAIVPFLIACGDSNTDDAPTDDFDVRFELPATVDVAKGGELTFTVKEGKSPLTTDSFLLEGGGISYLCPILRTSSESFTVRLADECESGSYTAYLKRDARKKSIGKIYINIVDKIDFEPSAGTTVFGLVSSEEGPVANVVVSDGTEVTVTDDKGIYELKSAKKWGYVFISVPSGYEVAAEGVFPQFYQTLKGAADVVEQKDFKLTKVDGQDRYKLFLLGDMHLANRTNDAAQFTQFTTDLNAYMAQHSGQKMYALTLGDMTWDLYWYKNNYALPQYRETINRQVKNLQIYHTMGNHDNDFMTTSDYDAAVKYVDCIGPTFYSFNIGQVHYVVMDNIDCSAYDGTDSRNYVKKLSNEQLKWLAKDLAYVDKSTPLIVAMHAQIYKPTSTGFAFDHDSANTEALLAALDGYEVHFVTGHTHKVYNITPRRRRGEGTRYPRTQLRRDLRIVVVVGQPDSRRPRQHRRRPGRLRDLGYRRNRFRMALQIHRLARGVPVPQLRPQQRIVLDGRRPQHSLERTDPARLQEIRQRLPRKLGQRSAHQDMELEQQLGAERRRRAGQDARIHAGMGIRSAPYRSALRAALQQFRHHLHALVRHGIGHQLLQGEGRRRRRRPDDHRQGRIRAHVDRGDAAPESLLDGCLQTQMIHN